MCDYILVFQIGSSSIFLFLSLSSFCFFAACFSVRVRGSEYIPLLGSDVPSYSLLGVSDLE